jgi:hypothetical protein
MANWRKTSTPNTTPSRRMSGRVGDDAVAPEGGCDSPCGIGIPSGPLETGQRVWVQGSDRLSVRGRNADS